MIRYSLRDLANRPSGTRVKLPPISERAGSIRTYRKALRKMSEAAAKDLREDVLPRYADELARDRRLQMDADRSWFTALRQTQQALIATSTATVDRVLKLEGQRHSERFMDIAKKTLGVDLSSVIREEDIEGAIDAAVRANVGLISDLSDDVVERVERTVYTASAGGQGMAQLRQNLQSQLGITRRRADLIAQDQITKFNADLNEVRQTQAGITQYEWLTSQDERVRDLHVDLAGKTYTWGEDTGAEEGLPPGKPIRCRCVAIAVVEF